MHLRGALIFKKVIRWMWRRLLTLSKVSAAVAACAAAWVSYINYQSDEKSTKQQFDIAKSELSVNRKDLESLMKEQKSVTGEEKAISKIQKNLLHDRQILIKQEKDMMQQINVMKLYNRPWVSMYATRLLELVDMPKKIDIDSYIENTGRRPATDARAKTVLIKFPATAISFDSVYRVEKKIARACLAGANLTKLISFVPKKQLYTYGHGSVGDLFLDVGEGGALYKYHVYVNRISFFRKFIHKNEILVNMTCITYNDGKTIRHTSNCNFAGPKLRKNDIIVGRNFVADPKTKSVFSACQYGNAAN